MVAARVAGTGLDSGCCRRCNDEMSPKITLFLTAAALAAGCTSDASPTPSTPAATPTAPSTPSAHGTVADFSLGKVA